MSIFNFWRVNSEVRDTVASRNNQRNDELPPLHETYVPVGLSTLLKSESARLPG